MNNKLLVLLSTLVAAHSAEASSLLVNGSFEQPGGTTYASLPGGSTTITGWTTGLNGVEWFNVPSYHTGIAADGVMAVDLANYVYTGGQIGQTFATQTGQSYTLDFSFGTHAAAGRDGTAHVDVTVAGLTTGYDIQNFSSVIAWTPETLNFTATGSSTTLRFTNTQNPFAHFAYIDGVGIAPAAVPAPAAGWLLGSGLFGIAGMARRRSARTRAF